MEHVKNNFGNFDNIGNNHNSDEELSRPVMPHLIFDGDELNLYYPQLEAPAEVDNPDLDGDGSDKILERGYKLAGEILKDMESMGRTRRPARLDPAHGPGPGDWCPTTQRVVTPRAGFC